MAENTPDRNRRNIAKLRAQEGSNPKKAAKRPKRGKGQRPQVQGRQRH